MAAAVALDQEHAREMDRVVDAHADERRADPQREAVDLAAHRDDHGARDDDPARRIEGIAAATSVASGTGFGCAVLRDKTVECWGKRSSGQLGDGHPPITTEFEVVPLP